MPQLFPQGSDAVLRIVIVAGGLVIIAAVVAPLLYMRSAHARGQYVEVAQPIPFDHRHHVEDVGIACAYCHAGAERGASAGLPPTQLCLGCHDQIWRDNPLIEPIHRSKEADVPIPWVRVHSLPGFVYFHHGIHARGGVGCASCHGAVEHMAVVEQQAPLDMEWCIQCHRKEEPRVGRSLTHCSACHR